MANDMIAPAPQLYDDLTTPPAPRRPRKSDADLEALRRYVAHRLAPFPSNIILPAELAIDFACRTGGRIIAVRALQALLPRLGMKTQRCWFPEGLRTSLVGWRIKDKPTAGTFVESELVHEPGARVTLRTVAAAYDKWRGWGLTISLERMRALLAGAGIATAAVRSGVVAGQSAVFVYDYRLKDHWSPSRFVAECLHADPHALTPIARVRAAFNAWSQLGWTTHKVGRLLSKAGLKGATRPVESGGGWVMCLHGFRLAADPRVSDFLRDCLIADAAALTPLPAVVAAFGRWNRSGLPWEIRRVRALLDAEGLAGDLQYVRSAGPVMTLVGWRLTDAAVLPEAETPAPSAAEPAQMEGILAQLAAANIADDLAAARDIPGLTLPLLLKLARAGIRTRDGLADLAADELVEIAGDDIGPDVPAARIISAARAHWFK